MLPIAILTALLLQLSGPVLADSPENVVLDGLQAARREIGVKELRLRRDLDEAAGRQAEEIASRPEAKRLQFDEPIEDLLLHYGIEDVRRAILHVDLKRGYRYPGATFLAGWKDYESAWRDAISETLDAVGLAVHFCDDGWVVLVVILLEELESVRFESAELKAMEREIVLAVNEVRRGRGLPELVPDVALARVARSHSVDMSVRHYFAHRSPDGGDVADRVRSEGIRYRRLGENLHKSRGAERPVRTAVEGWLASRRHRQTLLTPEYSHTAVGVAVDEDGELYFTQLYLLPDD